jgi:hypothetical protein
MALTPPASRSTTERVSVQPDGVLLEDLGPGSSVRRRLAAVRMGESADAWKRHAVRALVSEPAGGWVRELSVDRAVAG